MEENSFVSPAGFAGAVLVTGANGQLGMELRELSSLYPQFDFIFLSKQDLAIENEDEVNTIFSQHQPRYCINCAAYTAVDRAESEKEEAFLINGAAVGILATACKEHHTFLIHISTDYVFKGEALSPYKEDSPTDPVNIYGASKLEGEKLALQNNPGTIIIRTSWVYSSHGKNFVMTMMRMMKEKKEIKVVNDQYGSPTYAADLAEAILGIVDNIESEVSRITAPCGIFHYTNEGLITWYEFALAIKEFAASDCNILPVTSAEYPTTAKRPAYSALDTSKIKKLFGIKLKDWKENLGKCIWRIKNDSE